MTSHKDQPFSIHRTQNDYSRERIVDTHRFDTILPFDMIVNAPQQDEPSVNTYADPTALLLQNRDLHQAGVSAHQFFSPDGTIPVNTAINRVGEAAALPFSTAWYVVVRAVGVETDPSILTLINGAKALEASLDAWHNDPKHPGSIR